MPQQLHAATLAGYEPEIGRSLWALEEVRRRTLPLVQDLDQHTLDWQGHDGQENAIGSLLYHIALVEMSWLFLDIFLQDFPQPIQADFPHAMAKTDGRVSPVLGVSLDHHIERLNRSRAVFLQKMQEVSLDDWHRPREPKGCDYSVTPAWAVFHLTEHEAGHAGQISSLKKRCERLQTKIR